jgi:MFS family permease
MQAGVPFTLIPLYAARRLHLDTLAVSGALTALAAANIAAMFLAGLVGDRRGRLVALVPALLWGCAVLWVTPSAGSLPLLALCCAGIGITVGTFAVIPPVMVVDLATERPVGIAGYRICADLGMLAGGVGAGTLVGLAGGGGALEVTGTVLLACTLLALGVGETRPQSTVPPPPAGGRRFEEVPG